MLNLREFRAVKLRGQATCVKVGDIVILKDDNVRQVFWKQAVVVELLKGKNDIARAALINVATDNGPPKILRRSTQQLIPIEVTSSGEEELDKSISEPMESNTVDKAENVDTTDHSHVTRPRRAAAVLGEATRRNCTGH